MKRAVALLLALVCRGELLAGPLEPMVAQASNRPALATEPIGRDGRRAFDFEFGTWRAQLRRLVDPLSGSQQWVELVGTSVVTPLLGGEANIGQFSVSGPSGRIGGLSLRLYNPETGQWSIRWANNRDGELTLPLVGGFARGQGEFFNRDTFNGRPILVRFMFSDMKANSFRLEQAFSADDGVTWEANWIVDFTRE